MNKVIESLVGARNAMKRALNNNDFETSLSIAKDVIKIVESCSEHDLFEVDNPIEFKGGVRNSIFEAVKSA